MAACEAVMNESKLRAEVEQAIQVRRCGRAISAMSARNRFVHDILVEFYDHPAMRGSWGSGHTILSRLMKYGPQGAAQPGPTAPVSLSSRLLTVRQAIDHLNERSRMAIVLTYGGNEPIEAVARALGESHAVARAVLKDARPIIAAFLAGKGFSVPHD